MADAPVKQVVAAEGCTGATVTAANSQAAALGAAAASAIAAAFSANPSPLGTRHPAPGGAKVAGASRCAAVAAPPALQRAGAAPTQAPPAPLCVGAANPAPQCATAGYLPRCVPAQLAPQCMAAVPSMAFCPSQYPLQLGPGGYMGGAPGMGVPAGGVPRGGAMPLGHPCCGAADSAMRDGHAANQRGDYAAARSFFLAAGRMSGKADAAGSPAQPVGVRLLLEYEDGSPLLPEAAASALVGTCQTVVHKGGPADLRLRLTAMSSSHSRRRFRFALLGQPAPAEGAGSAPLLRATSEPFAMVAADSPREGLARDVVAAIKQPGNFDFLYHAGVLRKHEAPPSLAPPSLAPPAGPSALPGPSAANAPPPQQQKEVAHLLQQVGASALPSLPQQPQQLAQLLQQVGTPHSAAVQT
ncbi:hypothetical protein EMIHUDRAFT_245434 [Emiliania huxleyi CCMP1516]|uniref:Uncharacterized protein n=2 Tax=Emiliania huxleyi TaxID=2903 RepID=A0A0D3IXC2_EMIH1|nr:hypothetical protein EMIHUDRAFT_245434 [Emiliania huxleyi CCMP1516]EOD15907.1 hypothetical protein EMIHUDRAFT_245434 [Emiliania huxleyi CCMP1516]|eukprot:XP_005768336.1 hypothetical protein EMIHUDRAFT_245434 [Emiliania huxleyi CCMP1516]